MCPQRWTFVQNQVFRFVVWTCDKGELTTQHRLSYQFVSPDLSAELKKFEHLGLIATSKTFRHLVNHVIDEAYKKSFTGSQSNPGVRTFSVLHSNPAAQTGMITGAARLILPCHTFTQWNGRPGFVQTFIVVNTLAQRLSSAVCRFKIVAWNKQAKKLNFELNHVYRNDHFKMKSVKGNSGYPGQD